MWTLFLYEVFEAFLSAFDLVTRLNVVTLFGTADTFRQVIQEYNSGPKLFVVGKIKIVFYLSEE